MSKLIEPSLTYKPFHYPWAMEYAEKHEKIHWGTWEAKLQEDVKQWKNGGLTDQERKHITSILRIFTQSDCAVAGNYCDQFIPVFKNNEIRNMLLSFANREGTHQRAYALLNDTLGLAEEEYSSFLSFTEMREKIEFMQETGIHNDHPTLKAIGTSLAQAVCNEGMSLFSAFVMLLNYQRFGKMKGMCEIVEWSIKDETCFTPDTEILTEKGWVKFESLPKNLKVAQYNSDNQEVSFTTPVEYVDKEYQGDMVSFKSTKSGVDLTATADHDLLYLHSYKDGLKATKVKFSEFEPHYRKKLIVSGFKADGEWESLTPKDRFLIALQADGSLDYRIKEYGKNTGYKKVKFSLKKERKNERLQAILEELGWEYKKTYQEKRDDYLWTVKSPDLDISKTFNWVDLTKVTSTWAEEFIRELMYWDGHDVNKDGNTIYYSSTEESNIDVIQALATFANIKCSRSTQVDNRKDTFKDIHRLWMYLDTSSTPTGRVEKTTRTYIGRVMCVSVPTGNIIVRQNGKVAIVGNCHVEAMNKLFQTFCEENPRVVNNDLKKQIYTNFTRAVQLEDALVNLIYENDENEICTLKGKDIKTYIRYLADRRLLQLGLKPIFEQKENPLPWLDWIVSGDSFKNFFEGVVTDYNASGMTGEWGWD